LYPSPSGPPDNGDFSRIFASFSSGPLEFDFWPSPENQEVYQKRFYNFYHRFWRHDQGKEGFAQLSTSHLFFWPGRFLNLTPGTFDLAWNGFLLALLGGYVLYISLKSVGSYQAVFPLGVLALIFADANIIGYLNSFYQESGAFLSFIFLVCALHVFWVRRNLPCLVIIFVLSLILAATKVAYTLSVLPAIIPILVGVILFTPKSLYLRRYIISAVLLLIFASFLFVKFLSVSPGNERRANCYHFIFTGALPLLSPDAGKNYLHKLRLDPGLISLAGKNAFQSDSQFPKVCSALTPQLHIKSAARLALDYPSTFFEMIWFSFSTAGIYPRLQYPSLSDPPRVRFRFQWRFWSRLHNRFLNGTAYYAIGLFLTSILGTLIWRRKDSGWSLFYFLAAAGFFPASVLQVVISVLGNGPADIFKHQYFANLLLDAAFIFVVWGLAMTVWTLRGK
jgi:hypothetical protein